MDFFNYRRRSTVDVPVGSVIMGGNHPVVVQTMTNTDTRDTEGSVAQCERIIAAGADLIRLTTQGVREADNLRNIHRELREKGYSTPLSADIHFNPRAALVAATVAEKVRINPGNFVDKQKTFAELEYTDEEYAGEMDKIRAQVLPFLNVCKEHGTAVRIGVNHGSLSDRIMSRYGDTPEGMVASCMEYLRIAVEEGFNDIVISMKASNTLLMTKAVRLLVDRMDAEDMHFPLHLGVTEAGGGEDGRIKSAVGIGALLSDGIGDTIRVSLSEDPECELPVAQKLIDYISLRDNHAPIEASLSKKFSPFSIDRRTTNNVKNIGEECLPVVISDRSNSNGGAINPHFIPDYVYVGKEIPADMPKGMKLILDFEAWKDEIDQYPLFASSQLDLLDSCDAKLKFLTLNYTELVRESLIEKLKQLNDTVVILETNHINGVAEQRAFMHTLLDNDCTIPVVFHRA